MHSSLTLAWPEQATGSPVPASPLCKCPSSLPSNATLISHTLKDCVTISSDTAAQAVDTKFSMSWREGFRKFPLGVFYPFLMNSAQTHNALSKCVSQNLCDHWAFFQELFIVTLHYLHPHWSFPLHCREANMSIMAPRATAAGWIFRLVLASWRGWALNI